MRSVRVCQSLVVLLTGALAIAPAFASHMHRSPTSGHSHSRRKATVHQAHQIHGQRQIDASRAREIQSALIRANYMTGEPTGDWDQPTQDAMRSYQAAHNWQTKLIPDSRALIQLGLGPTEDATSAASAPAGSTSSPAATAAAPAQNQAAQPAERNRKSALTLADAHSILD